MRKFLSVCLLLSLIGFVFPRSAARAEVNPTLSTFVTTHPAYDVAVYGDYAYVAELSYGIQIVNISNTASPVSVGSFSAIGATHVSVTGTQLWVADGVTIGVLSLANPASPTALGYYAEAGFAPNNVVSDGTYAYVNGTLNSTTPVIKVIDFSNPGSPILRGTLTLEVSVSDIALSGSTLYASSANKLLIIAGYPTFTVQSTYTSFSATASYQGVTVYNSMAYLYDTMTGLVAVNCTNPASPQLHLSTMGQFSSGMVIADGRGYLTSYFTGGLYVMDLTSPTALTQMANYPGSGNGYGAAMYGSTVVVAANGEEGIRLFNTSVATSYGNPGSGTPGADTTAPVITLKGASTVYVNAGGAYAEPGYTAVDAVDGTLTSSVRVTGTVNTGKIGLYAKTYSVTDAAGNTGLATRTVVVKPTLQRLTLQNRQYTITVGKKKVILRPFPSYRGAVYAYKAVVHTTATVQYLFITTDTTANPEFVLYSSTGKLQKRYSLKGISTKGLQIGTAPDPATFYDLFAFAPKSGSLRVTLYGLTPKGLKNLGTVTAASGKGTAQFALLKVYPSGFGLVTKVQGSIATPKVWQYFAPAGKIVQDKTYNTRLLTWTKTTLKLK